MTIALNLSEALAAGLAADVLPIADVSTNALVGEPGESGSLLARLNSVYPASENADDSEERACLSRLRRRSHHAVIVGEAR